MRTQVAECRGTPIPPTASHLAIGLGSHNSLSYPIGNDYSSQAPNCLQDANGSERLLNSCYLRNKIEYL